VVLSTMLKQNNEINWEHEVFRPDLKEKYFEEYRTDDPARVLRNLMEKSKQKEPEGIYFGFESQLPQIAALGMSLDGYINLLRSLNFNFIIILKRQNHLRRIVSSIAGHLTSHWHRNIDRNLPVTRFEMDLDNLEHRGVRQSLLEHLLREQRYFQILEDISGGGNLLQMTYEDDIEKDPMKGYNRICEFIGVEPADVKIRFGRTNPHKLEEMIINFEELENYLKETPFNWMVHE